MKWKSLKLRTFAHKRQKKPPNREKSYLQPISKYTAEIKFSSHTSTKTVILQQIEAADMTSHLMVFAKM